MAYLFGPDGSLINDSTGGMLPSGDILLVSAGNPSPTFPGPNIGAQSGTVGSALSSNDVSGKFFDTDALTFSAIGSWPPGVSVSSAGVISGTPTVAGTYSGLAVRATDTISQFINSDTFTFTINAAGGSGFSFAITTDEAIFSGSFGTAGTGTFTSDVLRDNVGTIRAGETLNYVALYHDTTGVLIVRKTGVTTNGAGIFTITDPAINAGQMYKVDWQIASGKTRMPRKLAT